MRVERLSKRPSKAHGVKGLRDDGDRTERQKLLHLGGLHFRRHEHGGSVSIGGELPQRREGGGSVEPRHHHIEQNELRGVSRRFRERLASIGTHANLEAAHRLKSKRRDRADVGLVFDVENALECHEASPRCGVRTGGLRHASAVALAGRIGYDACMLDELRQRIDAIDDQLLDLLAARRRLVREVVVAKSERALALRHPEREQQLLLRLLRRGRSLELQAPFVINVFRAIIGDSLRLQQEALQRAMNPEQTPAPLPIAHLGQEGSFSAEAARTFAFGRERPLDGIPCTSFEAVLEAVTRGHAEVGVLPVENSTSGGINEAYDLLMHTTLAIVGELRLPILHCLCARPGVPREAVERIYSHPQPAAQCSRAIGRWGVPLVYVSDTAEAAARAAAATDAPAGAIASADAADRYGLDVLDDAIANDASNATRFLFIAAEPRAVDPRIPCKTSLVIATAQRAGSLVDALVVFRDAGLTLTKLESRPVPENAWEELFYVDFQGHVDDPEVQRALARLRSETRSVRVLGSYPSADIAPPELG